MAARTERGSLVEVAVDGVVFTMTPDVASEVRAGQLDADVAYMQGKLKVAGDMARFYGLLPLAESARFRDALLS